MRNLFKLLKRIITHKYYVAYYCFQIGLFKQGILHDMSKFSWTELKGAWKYWNDTKSSLAYERELNGYSATFLHHRGRNPHHYEYWVYALDKGGIAAKMPKHYALELICDYLAACKTYGGDPRTEYDWWIKYSHNFKMHKETKQYIQDILYRFKIYGDLKKSVKCGKIKNPHE